MDLRVPSFGKCLSGQDLQTNIGVGKLNVHLYNTDALLYSNILDARVAACGAQTPAHENDEYSRISIYISLLHFMLRLALTLLWMRTVQPSLHSSTDECSAQTK